ncbi:methylenetetrahydrofolate reductase [NAD(P)H] [Hydromonas duriensis]|uniref:Methylenetetrahydrofolate reductase n=1 Tax=Hydromonas duriensis TaxID=1527608 RepID=A0A4R6YBZ5_9BURK|nr:methylenetetrahydrofolate reductase [NAD(P)H] [Hydromonas duriensis]TDR33185.1 5,10-methylenetetrahydrofolate reductase (NAD(P)) [Hydromonas duriensis]
MAIQIPISFEFFPPKTPEGEQKLNQTISDLSGYHPEFFSCTYGAGGSTQDGTFKTVAHIRSLGYDAAPHLSCVGSTRDHIAQILQELKAQGVRRIVALRGDLPSGMGGTGELHHANDLVSFIREQTGDWFHIEVAAYPEYHPQARSPADDLKHFINKMNAGANSAITQYFYNADAYETFVNAVRAAGVNAPIVPGIMPITNYSQLARFSDVCGAELPRWVRLKLASFGDDRASILAFGQDVVSHLCERLIALGAPSLHFYTLNQAKPSLAIIDAL